MKNIFSVLSYGMERNPKDFGSFVLGRDAIFSKLRDYKSTIAKGSKLYICKVDIKGCYDSMNQKLLMEIIKQLVGEVCRFLKR